MPRRWSYTPLWMILPSLSVVLDCVRSQRRINTCQGEIVRTMDGWALTLAGAGLTLLRPPRLLKSGMVLRLRAESGRHQHLWPAAG